MSALRDAAIGYAARDLHVFPLLPATKEPHGLLAPHGVKDATTDLATIRRWWARAPRANIGIAVGVGALFGVRILDEDPKNGGDRTLARLVATYGAVPTTPTQRSGSGGAHGLLRWPSGSWKTKLISQTSGLELLGPGRYFVAAPSIHPLTGKAYVWTTDLTHDIAPAPAWLQKLARREERAPLDGPRTEIVGGARYARAALISAVQRVEQAPDGDRNNTLNREAFGIARFVIAGHLDEDLVRRALEDAARVAGLEPHAIRNTISSALRGRRAAQ